MLDLGPPKFTVGQSVICPTFHKKKPLSPPAVGKIMAREDRPVRFNEETQSFYVCGGALLPSWRRPTRDRIGGYLVDIRVPGDPKAFPVYAHESELTAQ